MTDITFDSFMEQLQSEAQPRPGFTSPEIRKQVNDSVALYYRLQQLAGWPMVPIFGSTLPGSTEFRGEEREPVRMENPEALVIAKFMGPFEDKSVLHSLMARFYFGGANSLSLVMENGRGKLIRYVWMFDYAESGYEGHAREYANCNPDRFATILSEAIS